MTDPIAEINACGSLFLVDLEEVGFNSVRILVKEGLPVGEPETIEILGTAMTECTRIEPADRSRVFELVWRNYVGYSVLNESFATSSSEDQFEGNRFRLYSKSRFIEYLSGATFASNEYPGPTQHYAVACEDHIIDVLSVDAPIMRRVR